MSATMIKHQANREFFSYWNRLRAAGKAPEQRSMDPALIGDALPDVFILDVREPGHFEIRLAGTRLCAFWGRELRGEDILSLWQGRDREGAEMLLHAVLEDASVAIAALEGRTEAGHAVEMEMVAMPLLRRSGGHTTRRIIGALVPWTCPYWLGAEPLVRQEITSVRLVWPEAPAPGEAVSHAHAARLFAEPDDAAPSAHDLPVLQRRAHLTLLQGGRTEQAPAD